ncbi:predicted protein [Nematostella vectensis]|uniref:Apple domain-containing protein n=1 Tax=Nematostella vectensis TaxID=45351 RepID=A7SBD5_NEMVE|nr:predicted protein [Nematostella vectensis]|eukprot:XP_001631071.1 predicted protein [Nematostella vectensis]
MRTSLYIFLLSLVSSTTCQMCPQGTCYAGSFSRKEHVTKGRYLLGSSYRNLSSVAGPQACHSACVGDCRCRAFQMSGKRCELLGEDKDSAPSRIAIDPAYDYYDIHQEILRASSHLADPSVCSNGCCLGQRCLNEGTCVEHCDSPKKKFSCKCRPPCSGKECEKCVYSSCAQITIYAEKY